MQKYYTRACNFYYGHYSKILIKKRLTLPLCGEPLISFNKVEIFSRDIKKVKSRVVDIKNINKLPKYIRIKVLKDIKKITSKRSFFKKKSHLLMGVLNMTPDSFSDGGKFNSFKKANERIKVMIKAGADIIDIGGESTRPGSQIVEPNIELLRVKKIIERFKKKYPHHLLSIDSRKSSVIDFSIKKGANLINDVSCFKFDTKSFSHVKNKNLW